MFDRRTIAGDVLVPFFTEDHEGFDINDPIDWMVAERLIADGRAPGCRHVPQIAYEAQWANSRLDQVASDELVSVPVTEFRRVLQAAAATARRKTELFAALARINVALHDRAARGRGTSARASARSTS